MTRKKEKRGKERGDRKSAEREKDYPKQGPRSNTMCRLFSYFPLEAKAPFCTAQLCWPPRQFCRSDQDSCFCCGFCWPLCCLLNLQGFSPFSSKLPRSRVRAILNQFRYTFLIRLDSHSWDAKKWTLQFAVQASTSTCN